MIRGAETLDDRADGARVAPRGPSHPGILIVFSAGAPLARVVPIGEGSALEIGREAPGFTEIADARLSRRHARIGVESGRFRVRDLGSRNGTSVDGKPLTDETLCDGACVIRIGGTLLLTCDDVRPFENGVTVDGGRIVGPSLRATWDAIARAARLGGVLHLVGETGTGKELAARAFHTFGTRTGAPFIAVNCAAIPVGLAERLLFGARRGAYSDAADADGYVQAADGGTLFLDEVAELDAGVQAKLLRVLESREVMALGASRARLVDVRICSATHTSFRDLVAEGRAREDFYFRVGRPEVVVPPLRSRREEIPWLIAQALRPMGVVPGVSLVEACLLRAWPGNVRELLADVRAAAHEAIGADSPEVTECHLPPGASTRRADPPRSGAAPATAQLPPSHPSEERAAPRRLQAPSHTELKALLREHRGVVKEVAKALGCSRRQVGRWLDEHEIDRDHYRA